MGERGHQDRFACPVDQGGLTRRADGALRCERGHVFSSGEHGYLELAVPSAPAMALPGSTSHGASTQLREGQRLYEEYLSSWLGDHAGEVLDVGCGVGATVRAMQDDGRAAVGVDVRAMAGRWRDNANPTDGFVVADAAALPYEDAAFDVTMACGVVEHLGTTNGVMTMAEGWWAARATFAAELRRVTRPGGRILISCPNRHFPIDVQHDPHDDPDVRWPLRTKVFDRTGMLVHSPRRGYHLASYDDVDRWFPGCDVEPLPLAGWFGFSRFDDEHVSRRLRSLARGYLRALPAGLRRTPLNPYVLAEVGIPDP